MKSPLFRTVTILVAVIFIPMLFFAVYEISSLNSSEQVIDRIYANQLDAILFSVNQYSEDVVSSWRNKINNSVSDKSDRFINAFLDAYNPVSFVFITDSTNGTNLKVYSRQNTPEQETVSISRILQQNK